MQLTSIGNRLFVPLKLDEAACVMGGMQAQVVGITWADCNCFILDPPYVLIDKDAD